MLDRLDRWSRWTMLAAFCLMPASIYGVLHLPVGSASVHEWLPGGRPERDRYERFLAEFGNDQFLLVSWDGCRIDDDRIDAFSAKLKDESSKSNRLVAGIQTTREVVRHLMEPPIRLSYKQAASRLKGFLIGSDGTSVVVVRFTPHGISHQKEAIEWVRRCADDTPALGRDALHMAGTVYESYAVDDASERSLKRLVVPSGLMGIALAWICLRSIRAAIAVLVIAGIGQLFAIATVYYTGGHFSAVLIVLPTLVFMLTLSGAVHLMNYYADVAAWHTDHRGSRAMLLGFKPSLLSSVTTALGMAALAMSGLAPIREFGLYSALCLGISTTFLLLSFPFLSDWFCRSRRWPQPRPKDEAAEPDPMLADAAHHPSYISPVAKAYVGFMQRHAIAVSLGGFLLMGFSFYGLLHLKSSSKFDAMFPADSPTVRDMHWVEEHVGPIASVEVLLKFPKTGEVEYLDRIQQLDRIAEHLRKQDVIGGVLSAASFTPPLPQSGSLRDVTRRSALRAGLRSSLPMLKEQGWVAESEAEQVWRITTKVSALSNEDYGQLTARVASAVQESLNAEGDKPICTFETTGLSPVMHETQMMLLNDLGSSFSVAFVLITPVMMLIARGFWAGLLIMIPNVLPETLVFGTMAWLGFQLDIAGILTASVAMGIAVNDTLHSMNWYARRLSLGDTRAEAIADTLTSCAGPMFHTMLISCCSMLPFMAADFNPTRQFACLMIAMLSSAILGDLVLLPALLMSPLGKCVVPKHIRAKESAPSA